MDAASGTVVRHLCVATSHSDSCVSVREARLAREKMAVTLLRCDAGYGKAKSRNTSSLDRAYGKVLALNEAPSKND